MGSKIGARALMEQAGVPVVPGTHAGGSERRGRRGGGRRDRASRSWSRRRPAAAARGCARRATRRALAEAIPAARREAQAAFGDGTLYVERLIERPRHVEIQVFADAHGNVVHLFERECSVQRRHQKIIEESPSPALTPALRDAHGRGRGRGGAQRPATATPARSSSCSRATGDAARFYFLEMNTRLQVEHPVTELVTGIDLVRAQLLVAIGPAAAVAPGRISRSAATRSSAASMPRIRRRASCRRRDRCGSTASRRARASASTAASRKGPTSRCSTIRCSPS